MRVAGIALPLMLVACVAVPDAGVRPAMHTPDTIEVSQTLDTSSAAIVQAQARLRSAQAEFDKARIDLQRRETLVASGAVSGEEVTQARRTFATASAALDAARGGISEVSSARRVAQGQFAANDALVRGSNIDTDPAVQAAAARLDSARLDLERTEIRAPVSGVVSRLQIQVGQRLNPGQIIMTIVPVDKLYVDANFRESQLRRVRIGMPVTLTSDLYGGDVVYHGKITGFAGGTGSSMAVRQRGGGKWRIGKQIFGSSTCTSPTFLRFHLSSPAEHNIGAPRPPATAAPKADGGFDNWPAANFSIDAAVNYAFV